MIFEDEIRITVSALGVRRKAHNFSTIYNDQRSGEETAHPYA